MADQPVIEDDDLLGRFLQQSAPSTAAAPIQAAANQNAADDTEDLLGSFLQKQRAQPPAQSFAGGHAALQLGPNGPVAAVPVSDQDFKAQSDLSQLPVVHPENLADVNRALTQTDAYLLGQVKGIPAQVGANIKNAETLIGSGASDLRQGNYLPRFPSADPSSWQAGGIAKTAAGAIGIPASLLTGPADKVVTEPVTDLSGNPQAGQVAGMAAAGMGANYLPTLLRGAPADPETLRLAKVAAANNIPIRAAQISTSAPVQKLDQVLGWIPGSGRTAENAAQQSAYTRAVSHSFGDDTDQITRSTIDTAQSRIGGVLNTIENRTPIQFDTPTINALSQVENNAARAFTPDSAQYRQVRGQVDQILNVAAQHNGNVPGDVWANFYHQGSPLSRLENSADPDVGQLAGQLKGVMRDAIQRQATPEDAAAYTNARFQYKNLKTLEPLVTKGAPGEISPAGLNQRVGSQFSTTNAGPLGDLADAGQRFLRQPRDSGTPLGEWALRLATSPGAALGGAVAGQQLGFSLPEIAGLGIAAPALNAGVARLASGLLNNPIYRASLFRGPTNSASMAKELIYGATANVPTNPGDLRR